eukprot:m.45982 g.45982  ORF g.45982 m.45982 type:complete len:95 (+) comp11065_c0_seq1:35-319(+)
MALGRSLLRTLLFVQGISLIASQSLRTENGTIVLQVGGARLVLSESGSVAQQCSASPAQPTSLATLADLNAAIQLAAATQVCLKIYFLPHVFFS